MAGVGKKLLVGTAVAVAATSISLQIAVAVAKHVNEQRAQAEAEAWLQQARQDARSNMTADDAARWLEEHGAHEVWRSDTTWINDKKVELNVIGGMRKLGEKGIWSDRKTAWLRFSFDAHWHFQEVELEIHDI